MLTPLRNPSAYLTDAIVTSVDVLRKSCKVITQEGKGISTVHWSGFYGSAGRAGEVYTPIAGDKVKVLVDQGIATILSGFDHPTFDTRNPTRIGSTSSLSSILQRINLTQWSEDTLAGTSTPSDSLPGDRMFTTSSGALFGATAAGSVILKASPLAQVLVSRLDDIVRVVGRNQEYFSDACKHVNANAAGDVFSYREYYRTWADSLAEKATYWEAYGNTLSALESRGEYRGMTSSRGLDNIVRALGTPFWENTLTVEGGDTTKTRDDLGNRSEKLSTAREWTVSLYDTEGNCHSTITAKHFALRVTGDDGEVALTGTSEGLELVSTLKIVATTETYEVNADTVVFNCPSSTFDGDVDVTGTVSAGVDVTSNGVSLVTHPHIGNLGAPTSAPVPSGS
jgi:phage baseplate assembly protein gpV